MLTIGFITSEEDPELISDDRLVFEHLEKLGYKALPVVWDRNPSLAGYDALIFRSCWNYHRKTDSFLHWLDGLKTLSLPILNPLEISRWNINKRYLMELQEQGVRMPKTKFLPSKSPFDTSLLSDFPSDMVVVKPAVSLNGHDTYLCLRNDADLVTRKVLELLPHRDVLIQEFMPEVKTGGELSFVFFNNEFSHAIQKLPAKDEFRIHREYGGTRVPYFPSSNLIREAKSIVEKAPEKLLFCRVDAILRDNHLHLIEWEIIDPMLFLGSSVDAAEKFARAIRDSLVSLGQ